ncbi:MAG: Phosphoesterase, partial [Marmoricola sp.]|nr:Phosphoesterase [Marmoricola sp.]
MSTRTAPDDAGPRRRTGPLWRRVLPIAGVALACAVLLAVTYWAGVRTLEGRLLSDAALRGAIRTHGLVSTSVNRVLNLVSGASLVAAMLVVAGIALLRGRRVQGAAAVGVVVAANATTFVLKRYLLERPDLGVSEAGPATLNSLPSGHTTAAFSAIGALLLVVPRRLRVPVALA